MAIRSTFRGTQRFVSGNIFWKAYNRLRYLDLIAVKARDFFGETSPRAFVTRGLISLLFSKRQICRSECKIRSPSIYGETTAARKLADRILFPKIFCGLNFPLKPPKRSICISVLKYAFKRL